METFQIEKYIQHITQDTKVADICIMNADKIHHYLHTIFKFIVPTSFNIPEIKNSQEIVEAEGYKFVVMKNDTCVSDCLRTNVLYEKFLLAFVSKYIPTNKNMIDVGANIGVWSIIFRNVINAVNYIYAFEPQQEIYDCLQKNIILNNMNNIIAYNCALSDANNVKYMNSSYDDKQNFGAFRINETDKLLQINCRVGDEYEIDNVGFIKIDVEGHEYEVLCGLSNIIKKNMPVIFIEIHTTDINCNNTLQLLYNLNYNKIIKLTHCDYLCFPK